MNLRTRFALAFAAVAAVVATTVGLLSYNAAANRIESELDRTLQTVTSALENGQDGVLDTPAPGPTPDGADGHGDRLDAQRQVIAQAVAPDGTATSLGTSDVALPVSGAARGLAATVGPGRTDIAEVTVGRDRFQVMTTALGGTRGALQVGVDIDDTVRVLRGAANEITAASVVVLLIAAGAGWLLARRITARLARLARQAEHLDIDELGAEPTGAGGPRRCRSKGTTRSRGCRLRSTPYWLAWPLPVTPRNGWYKTPPTNCGRR